ncbi:MAG: hypothetical protein HYY07_01405, partial [Elusimicrobia bacterium]|nr:hypothetical protein [Elusimicrobiota bacterium]
IIFNSYFHRFSDTRFYILFYALLSILAGIGVAKVRSLLRPSLVHAVVGAALLLPPCLSFSLLFGFAKIPLWVGLENEESYLRKKLYGFDLVEYANAHLSPDATILALNGAPQTYYWNARILHPSLNLLKKINGNEIVTELKQEGVTHILFPDHYYVRKPGNAILQDPINGELGLHWDMDGLLDKYLLKIHSTKTATIYEVHY